jgi:hypothetical protein
MKTKKKDVKIGNVIVNGNLYIDGELVKWSNPDSDFDVGEAQRYLKNEHWEWAFNAYVLQCGMAQMSQETVYSN